VKVVARAPGKVNLTLRVGPLGEDGYHPLVTVFQAVNLFEEVTATQLSIGSGIRVTVAGPGAEQVPRDESNLAVRAAQALADTLGIVPNVALHLQKGVPVAGGMAGGSADAAAALVACNELWGGTLTKTELQQIGAQLGSDVPFALLGGTALGTGRGLILEPLAAPATYHWAFAVQNEGLSTPSVFRKFDELANRSDKLSHFPIPEMINSFASGIYENWGPYLVNDLQPATLALRPELAATIEVALAAGALTAIVSGSGPTVAALASSSENAETIATAWRQHQVANEVYLTTGPAPGAQVLRK